jgi:hypothetical protein
MALLCVLAFAACATEVSGGDDGGGMPGNDAGGNGSDAGSGSGDGGGTGGGTAKLYPLALGYKWTYTVTAVGAGSVCAPGSYSQEITSANAAGGRPAFQMTSFCTSLGGTYDYSNPSGDEVDFYYSNSWLTLVDPNLSEGHNWTYAGATSYSWHRETSVTVPAGTFTDCWTAQQQVSYTAYLTYCRGAGLVRSYSKDLGGNGWDAQLASKSF